jgi:tetratricopeptide (TPR) repeat protein
LSHAIEALVAAAMESPYQAEPAIEQALNADAPLRAETETLRGLLLLSNGQIAEGEEAFKQALSADPDYDAARFYRAAAALALDFPQDALPALEDLKEGQGPFAGEAAALAARIYLERGELTSAQEAIDQALTLGAESAAVRTIQARIASAQGDGAAAGEALRKAAALNPDYAPARLETGLLYVRRGLIEEGLAELRAYLDQVNKDLPDAGTEEVEALIAQLEENMGAGTAGASEGS